MCGRYASTRSREDLLREFEIAPSNADERAVEPDHNVAPTKEPPVVLARPPRDDKDAEPVRQLHHLTRGAFTGQALPAHIRRRMTPAWSPIWTGDIDTNAIEPAKLRGRD